MYEMGSPIYGLMVFPTLIHWTHSYQTEGLLGCHFQFQVHSASKQCPDDLGLNV